MFARIIVGIDGADGGRDALALARTLAADTAELVLVTAFPHDVLTSRGTLDGYEKLVRADVDKALAETAGDDPRCSTWSVADSSPGRALHHQAEHEDADLIVIGSCRHGAIGKVLLGDVSRATLHGAPCPVAVAPHGYRDHPSDGLQTIGVGFSGTEESRAALAFAGVLAQAGGARLRLLTAVPSLAAMGHMYAYNWADLDAEARLAAERTVEEAAAQFALPVETETVDDNPGRALEHLSEHVDLIVAGSRGWGAAHQVVLGSTTDHLVHHAHCPVIVVPSPVEDHKPAPAAVPHAVA
jgi:nucleotide-binding universal stress UspA family protein